MLSAIGQVPGETFVRQVINEAGQPISNIAMFLLDKNSEQIGAPFVVDGNGLFHVTYPDAPTEVFIQFTSYDKGTMAYTNEYQALVMNFDDLYNVANGNVIMKKPGEGSSSNLPLIIAACAGIGLVVLSKRNKNIGATANKLLSDLKGKASNKNIAIVAGVGVGGYLLYKLFFAYKPTLQQKQTIDDAVNQLHRLEFDEGTVITMSLSQFSSLAAALRNAAVDCGTDETAIYNVFEQLNNEADIYQLIVSGNILSYKSCAATEGSWFGDVHRTVPELIISELDAQELNTVNAILSSKGIKYRF